MNGSLLSHLDSVAWDGFHYHLGSSFSWKSVDWFVTEISYRWWQQTKPPAPVDDGEECLNHVFPRVQCIYLIHSCPTWRSMKLQNSRGARERFWLWNSSKHVSLPYFVIGPVPVWYLVIGAGETWMRRKSTRRGGTAMIWVTIFAIRQCPWLEEIGSCTWDILIWSKPTFLDEWQVAPLPARSPTSCWVLQKKSKPLTSSRITHPLIAFNPPQMKTFMDIKLMTPEETDTEFILS